MLELTRRQAVKMVFGRAREKLNITDKDELYAQLKEWNLYPPGLREMSDQRLQTILGCFGVGRVRILKSPRPKRDKSGIVFVWMKRAGFSRERLAKLIKAKFDKDSVEALSEFERRQLIAILRGFCRD